MKITKALEMIDSGMSPEEVLSHFDPEDREEISGIFAVMDVLEENLGEVSFSKPSRLLFEKTFDSISLKRDSGWGAGLIRGIDGLFSRNKAVFGTVMSLFMFISIGGTYFFASDFYAVSELDREFKVLDLEMNNIEIGVDDFSEISADLDTLVDSEESEVRGNVVIEDNFDTELSALAEELESFDAEFSDLDLDFEFNNL